MTSDAANGNDLQQLEALESRLRTVLPEEYQDSYEKLQPLPMGSAELKYDSEGKIAWNEIWGSFCDLAMAGGPPHKGKLLSPGTLEAIEAQPAAYRAVVDEICRGVTMATDLTSYESASPGWIRVKCYSESMTGWLLRAITMENVAVRAERLTIELPAAPHFRLEKEVKNVVTVIAKTCHYWLGHMPRSQRYAVASLFATLSVESPLMQPATLPENSIDALWQATAAMADRITRDTGLRSTDHRYAGWLGFECPNVGAAVWMMRALVVTNVLSRREETAVFVPVNPQSDPAGERVSRVMAGVHRLASAKGVL